MKRYWKSVTNILLCGAGCSGTSERLKKRIVSLPVIGDIVHCYRLADLADRFSAPAPLPEVILVLPTANEAVGGTSHRLFPRFITCRGSDISDICAVLERICRWNIPRMEW